MGQFLPLRAGFRVQAARLIHTRSRHPLDDGACHAVDSHVPYLKVASILSPFAFSKGLEDYSATVGLTADNNQLGLGDDESLL